VTATDAPPSGVVHAANVSGLGAVERELAAMHKAMLRAGGDTARAVRLSVMTLVVACTDSVAAERAAEVIAAVAAQHPARALLVVARRDDPPGIDAELRLECWAGGGPDNHVCAEIAQLRVGGDPARHLTSIVTPLLLPDVPVRLWIAGAPPLEQALSDDTLELVERIVLDTDMFADAAATVAALADAARPGRPRVVFADLSWLRMEPWREEVARAFDATSHRPLLAGIDSVSISAMSRASALLAAGWLMSRAGVDASRITIAVSGTGAPGLRALRIHCARPREATVDVRVADDGLRTRVAVAGEPDAERLVPFDPPALAELVGAALQEGGEDAVYAEAVRAAATLA
jgi:glucose-6-phosphate dehydrogenase assembly protein OpcA